MFKFMKLGLHGYYFCNPTTILVILMLTGTVLFQLTGLRVEFGSKPAVQFNDDVEMATRLAGLVFICFVVVGIYVANRSKPVYLVDFSCYKPEDERKISVEAFLELTEKTGAFSEDSVKFQRKLMYRAGLGDETYIPRGVATLNLSVLEAHVEAESVIFGALDSLFEKTGVKPAEIGILIVNCSLFSPVPSLSAMVVNRYKMKEDIQSFNLGGMGCSAGLISVELASNLLKVNPNTLACVVSTETLTLDWYFGNDRSMLLSNCLFRMGGAAILLSNRKQDRSKSKYELKHLVRTHKGSDDRSYNCVFKKEDENGTVGVSLARELTVVAGDALKTNISTLGPLVLPLSEQFKFVVTLVKTKILKLEKSKIYVPDFKLAFEHFCVHAGGDAVLSVVQKNLDLKDWHMEPSRMTLHRFGNTSSSSLWYEMAYSEAKGRVKAGDRVLQIAFGAGFKCNSAVWKALRAVSSEEMKGNAWIGSIDDYPVKIVK